MKIRFIPLAQRELDEAYVWYENQLPSLGVQLLDELDRTLHRVIDFPQSGEVIEPNIRRVLVNRFPYNIIYGVDEENLIVLAIAHLHRAPRNWIERIH